MTEKQENRQAVKIVRKLFQTFYGRIYDKDITLLETSFNGSGIDYIFFRNNFTGAEFRITGNPATGDYSIEQIDDE